MRTLVFLDTETVGLGLDDPIWEIALIRREEGQGDLARRWFVQHDYSLAQNLPESFRKDHGRYEHRGALSRDRVAAELQRFFYGRPTVVGAVPNFDTERLAHQFGLSGWHHRLRCVETLTAGKLGREIGGLSECAEALGIPVADAHTAMGDVLMVREIWDSVMTNREDDLR